ncbi:MAG: hypothetical protein ACFE89_11325 [Candidatus Hodarchaeota archaeon]
MSQIRLLSTIEMALKNRTQLFANIHDNRNLTKYFIDLQLAILLFTFIYGASMGLFSGGLQILYAALKIPILIFLTLYICVPTFYVLDSLVGGALSLRQMLIILLSGFTIMATILVAFLPVALFFLLTSFDYTFVVLLNVFIFGIGGVGALIYFLNGYTTMYNLEGEPGPQITDASKCRQCESPIAEGSAFCRSCGTRVAPSPEKGFQASSLPILIGCAVLIFVGTQLAWILRPYFNYYPFFIRPLGGNFYLALLQLLLQLIF